MSMRCVQRLLGKHHGIMQFSLQLFANAKQIEYKKDWIIW